MSSNEAPVVMEPIPQSEPRGARLRVVFLLDFIWPSRVKVFQIIAQNVSDLRILCSKLRGDDRRWESVSDGLSVCVQRTLSWNGRWRYTTGVSESRPVDFPIDTLPFLFDLKPDVVISSQLGFRSLAAAVYRLMRTKSRFVLWLQMAEHQQKGRRPIRWTLHHLLLAVTDHVITNGPSCTAYVLKHNYPSRQITEINTVCDLKPFQAIPRCSIEWERLKRLIYVGRLVEVKGLLPFLEVLDSVVSAIPDIEVEFSIVGYGPLEEKLQNWKVNCERVRIRMIGFVDTIAHPEIYRQGDVFVFPTLSDEWGLVVNEAMAAGLPVFGSLYSQAVECLVRDGINGLTFTPLSDDVAPKLKNLLMLDERTIHELGDNSRVSISDFTPEYAANRFLEVIAACGSTRPKQRTTGD
jgi:glycosyltransferase involved in cell wall biosynthesis